MLQIQGHIFTSGIIKEYQIFQYFLNCNTIKVKNTFSKSKYNLLRTLNKIILFDSVI